MLSSNGAHQFFDAAATSEADEGVSLPASLLDELAQAPSADAARAIAAAVGGSGTLIEAFATDCQGATMRGSFSRIGYGHGHPVTQGWRPSIVGSAERVWLLGLDPAGGRQPAPNRGDAGSAAERDRARTLRPPPLIALKATVPPASEPSSGGGQPVIVFATTWPLTVAESGRALA